MSDKVNISWGDQNYELPVTTGTESENGIDISKFRQVQV